MEGCLLGLPSIAFSQAYTHDHPVKWGTSTHHGAAVVRRVFDTDWPRNVLVNINFPDVVAGSVKGVRGTPPGTPCFARSIPEPPDPPRGAPHSVRQHPPGGHGAPA